ncbi:hypothetical protein CC86DRAFT_377775 [Ophiobolus disseminans]|uniref:Uncharacterized protein n=1 Tax=Ophiobolus disseminans TaxID=1469910 RepID=A0A6A7AI80_9PLEO|nr:hypothetical protein CC86DRAFT_377775 [Ophiobolus disseminans]
MTKTVATEQPDGPSSSRSSTCISCDYATSDSTPSVEDAWLSNSDTQVLGSDTGASLYDMPILDTSPGPAAQSISVPQHINDRVPRNTRYPITQVSGPVPQSALYRPLVDANQPHQMRQPTSLLQEYEIIGFHGSMFGSDNGAAEEEKSNL